MSVIFRPHRKVYPDGAIAILFYQQSQPVEDMARKKKDAEKSADVLALEARIRELELQNLALNTLIDVAEKNGIDIRKMTRVCRLIPNFASDSILCCKHFQENVNETSMKSYSQMKRSTFPVRSPLTREKRQQKQESRQPNQRDKSTKSV